MRPMPIPAASGIGEKISRPPCNAEISFCELDSYRPAENRANHGLTRHQIGQVVPLAQRSRRVFEPVKELGTYGRAGNSCRNHGPAQRRWQEIPFFSAFSKIQPKSHEIRGCFKNKVPEHAQPLSSRRAAAGSPGRSLASSGKTSPAGPVSMQSARPDTAVGSRFTSMIFAPADRASDTSPAAGYTTAEVPITINRSHDPVAPSACRQISTGKFSPNQTTPGRANAPQSQRGGMNSGTA